VTRVLLVNGSPRSGGNTARTLRILAEELFSALRDRGEETKIETTDLARVDIRTCRGCRICFDGGERACPLTDDVGTLSEGMAGADLIVLASPVYVDDVSGLMKTFLDRNAWMNHRPGLWGRLAAVVTTTGVVRSGRAIGVLSSALRAWGTVVSGSLCLVAGASLEPGGEEAFRPALRILAGRLAKARMSRRVERPGLAELVYFLVMREYWRRNPDDSQDYRWWKGRGLLDPARIWPGECRTPVPIRVLSRGLAFLIAALVLGRAPHPSS